jgi:hypothetical protein
MFYYFPGNYRWSSAFTLALMAGGQLNQMHRWLAPLRDAGPELVELLPPRGGRPHLPPPGAVRLCSHATAASCWTGGPQAGRYASLGKANFLAPVHHRARECGDVP